MQSLETWARTTPNSLPNPNPVQGFHEPHHPNATAEPWRHCDETWNPQPSISSKPLDETEKSPPCHILQEVCWGFSEKPNSFKTPKNSPTTKYPSTTNQARQPSMSNRTTPWHLLNTSKLSRRKTPSRKPTSKLTRAIPMGQLSTQ